MGGCTPHPLYYFIKILHFPLSSYSFGGFKIVCLFLFSIYSEQFFFVPGAPGMFFDFTIKDKI